MLWKVLSLWKGGNASELFGWLLCWLISSGKMDCQMWLTLSTAAPWMVIGTRNTALGKACAPWDGPGKLTAHPDCLLPPCQEVKYPVAGASLHSKQLHPFHQVLWWDCDKSWAEEDSGVFLSRSDSAKWSMVAIASSVARLVLAANINASRFAELKMWSECLLELGNRHHCGMSAGLLLLPLAAFWDPWPVACPA